MTGILQLTQHQAESVDGSFVASVDAGAQAPLYDEPFGDRHLAKRLRVVEHEPATTTDDKDMDANEDDTRGVSQRPGGPARQAMLYTATRTAMLHCRRQRKTRSLPAAFFNHHFPSYTTGSPRLVLHWARPAFDGDHVRSDDHVDQSPIRQSRRSDSDQTIAFIKVRSDDYVDQGPIRDHQDFA